MGRRYKVFIFTLLFLLISGSVVLFAWHFPRIFFFEKKDALDEWEEKMFKGRVLYSVELEESDGYLSARSDNSASGIFYRLTFDPREKPMLSWKWKVNKFPDKGTGEDTSGSWIEQDDFAARFYVIFPKMFFPMTKALEYVWARDIPEGTVLRSPYTGNIRIIVLRSGENALGQWVSEERNIIDDFRKAYGSRPGKVGAIAIMTDTDNTQSTAEAYYDEIKVGY